MFDQIASLRERIARRMAAVGRQLSSQCAAGSTCTEFRGVEPLENRVLMSVSIVHSFVGTGGGAGGASEGATPYGGVIMDTNGNLYGTTISGGVHGDGSIYELVKGSSGYTYRTLWDFWLAGAASQGAAPRGRLVFDQFGNLYGTTAGGGDANGDGTVWEITASSLASSSPTLTNRGIFAGTDGSTPEFGVIVDSQGNLFGTTHWGGNGYTFGGDGVGVIFEVEHGTNAISDLYKFPSDGSQGYYPSSGLAVDSHGALWGTTSMVSGSAGLLGTVYKYNGTLSTVWAFSDPTNSNLKMGFDPRGDLTIDAHDNVFGTTWEGGAYYSTPTSGNYGTVYEISPGGTFLPVASFAGTDGSQPSGGLVIDGNGHLFGTTYNGGVNGTGTVYQVNFAAGSITSLASFDSSTFHPKNPLDDDLILDGSGNLFGTTTLGSDSPYSTNDGTVWTLAT